MKMVLVRSDKKNDTMIVKLNFTKSGHAKATDRSKTKKYKVAADYLINGKRLNISHHANIIVMRRESKVTSSIERYYVSK